MKVDLLSSSDEIAFEQARKSRCPRTQFMFQINVKPGVHFFPADPIAFPKLRGSCQNQNTAHAWGTIESLDALEKYTGTDIVSVFVVRVLPG